MAQGIAQAIFNIAAIARLFHVDKVDDDDAAQVTQAHLARYFVSSFEICPGSGFFNVAALDGPRGVDVNRHQRFGMVNHNRAAARQLHGTGVSRLDLVLDLETAEQRRIVAVTLHAVLMLRHDMGHKLLGLLVDVVGIKQYVADVAVEIVANGADDEA